MKKYILIILIFVGIAACRQDYSYTSEPKEIDEIIDFSNKLKKSLSKNVKDFNGTKLAIVENVQNNNFISIGEVDWKKADIYTLNKFRSLEVPYLTTNNYVNLYSIIERFIADTDQDKNLRVAYTYSNLIYFEKEKRDINENTLIITYIPEAGCIEYLKYYKTGERMTLNNLDKSFVGYIEYKKPNGEVTGLEYYMMGKLIARYSFSRSNEISKKHSSGNKISSGLTASSSGTYQRCSTVCTPRYGRVCASIPEAISGESCSWRVVGQTCKEVCVDVPIPDNPTPGGASPPTPTPDPQIAAYVNEIFEFCPEMEVGSVNYNKILTEIQTLVSRPPYDCFTKKILQFLAQRSGEGKIKLCLNENIKQAAYRPHTKRLEFKNTLSISKNDFLHEMIHACQDKIYPNGINQYTKPNGLLEIEFEVQLFMDIVGKITHEIITPYADNTYGPYLEGLVNNNGNRNLYNAKNYFADVTVANTTQYKKYKEQFRRYKSAYNSEIGDNLCLITI